MADNYEPMELRITSIADLKALEAAKQSFQAQKREVAEGSPEAKKLAENISQCDAVLQGNTASLIRQQHALVESIKHMQTLGGDASGLQSQLQTVNEALGTQAEAMPKVNHHVHEAHMNHRALHIAMHELTREIPGLNHGMMLLHYGLTGPIIALTAMSAILAKVIEGWKKANEEWQETAKIVAEKVDLKGMVGWLHNLDEATNKALISMDDMNRELERMAKGELTTAELAQRRLAVLKDETEVTKNLAAAKHELIQAQIDYDVKMGKMTPAQAVIAKHGEEARFAEEQHKNEMEAKQKEIDEKGKTIDAAQKDKESRKKEWEGAKKSADDAEHAAELAKENKERTRKNVDELEKRIQNLQERQNKAAEAVELRPEIRKEVDEFKSVKDYMTSPLGNSLALLNSTADAYIKELIVTRVLKDLRAELSRVAPQLETSRAEALAGERMNHDLKGKEEEIKKKMMEAAATQEAAIKAKSEMEAELKRKEESWTKEKDARDKTERERLAKDITDTPQGLDVVRSVTRAEEIARKIARAQRLTPEERKFLGEVGSDVAGRPVTPDEGAGMFAIAGKSKDVENRFEIALFVALEKAAERLQAKKDREIPGRPHEPITGQDKSDLQLMQTIAKAQSTVTNVAVTTEAVGVYLQGIDKSVDKLLKRIAALESKSAAGDH